MEGIKMIINRNLVFKLLLTGLFSVMVLGPDLLAQQGRWVAHSLEGMGAGPYHHDCGDGIAGYAANSQYLLIFDIRTGSWELFDMGSVQTFDYLETNGNVLMARSDDLLFGYSSSLGAWDTISYQGTVYMDHSTQLFRSYGCSDSLAFYLTDQLLYVFDGSLGYWQQYDYGYQADMQGGYFYPKDDCIIVVLIKTDFYAGIMNVVYSSHTHSFNKIDDGIALSQPRYDHGYAGILDRTGYGKEFLLVGYSAFDNQFDVMPYTTGDNETWVSHNDGGTIEADHFIAYSCGFRTVVTPYELVRVRFYGYSTVLGSWNSITYDIDWEAETYYGNGQVGGQFTFDFGNEKDPQKYRFFFYSAVDGLFHNLNTDLVYTSTTSAFRAGGKVFCVFDATHAWGYNPVLGLGNAIDIAHDQHAYMSAADDYATFTRWSQTSESMRMYFYNASTDHWSWIDTPEHWDQAGTEAAHIYIYKAWPENNVIVYSSFQDSIMQRDLPDSAFIYTASNGILACARSKNRSFLFNAEKCTVYERDFEFNQNGLGSRSAAFYDTAGGWVLHGYSSLSDQWTTLAITDEPYYCYDPGCIGLISARVGVSAYGKFYAYNGLADSWIELVPEGKSVSLQVGNRTALVLQSGHIYAFDPFTSTDIHQPQDNLVTGGIILHQNYPNPFTSSTTIGYELAEPSRVTLKIYNAQGQVVRILIDEHRITGKWSVTWDGRNGSNQPAGPGIYIYELQAGDQTESRMMLLLDNEGH
jgi:hypothetical protein